MLRVRFIFPPPPFLCLRSLYLVPPPRAEASTQSERVLHRMAIGCDPELRLSLGAATAVGGSDPACGRVESPAAKSSAPSLQQMTIFYDGRVCVYDATEVQARAILSMAKMEMEELSKKKKKSADQEETVESAAALPRPQILNPAAGLSMKRSLQRFLQKRKARISDVSPYSQKPKLLLFPINSQQQE